MKWATYMGQGWYQVLIVLAIAIIIWKYIGKLEAALVVTAGLSLIFEPVLKWMVGRPRPSSILVSVWGVMHSNGFPSGHAFYSMVLFGLMAYFVFTYMHKSAFRVFLFVALILLIMMIGASRIYLGLHWPSDVLGGYLWGATFLGIFILLDRRLRGRYGITQVS
jgi:undecaprenyl-diphosphatase